MTSDRRIEDQSFLSRWSRRKAEARDEAASVDATPRTAAEPDAAMPQLPPVEALTPDSDFTAFFHPKVNEDVRRAALKKLFSDPHFNVMDGLDVYIDDYSKSEAIPAAMLAGLKQAQRILTWAEGKDTPESDPAQQTGGAEGEIGAARAAQEAPPAGEIEAHDSSAEK